MDVLSHFLNPGMKILSEKEKEGILEKYKIGNLQMPKMNSDDSAAMALKAKTGDVIQIERNDGTGKYYNYRIVI